LFKGCHDYSINSLSVSPDGENFLSADDLRINMWSLQDNITAFNIVDLKPPNIQSLPELITHVEYHPRRSDVFLFSSSGGYISYCDLRVSSQFDQCSIRFQNTKNPSRVHFFQDIIDSTSRAKFAPTSDNYLFSRDYLSVNIWDVRNNSLPV